MEIETMSLSEWGENLPASGFDVFHTEEALAVLDEHTSAELRLYGGFKGSQPVALLPVFVRRNAVGRAVFSPPPSLGVPYLGPIATPNSPKQRKQEKVNREFTQEVLERLSADSSRTLLRFVCSTDFLDPRPYQWRDMQISPEFTYELNLSDISADDLLSSFSKSLRREIRKRDELDLTIGVEGMDAAQTIHENVEDRYAEQDESFAFSWPYVRDLLEAVDDRSRVYVARGPDGEYLNGVVVLYSNDAAIYWLGGARSDYENVSVNSLLQWRILEDIIEDPELDSVHRYDLLGANTERLCRYKSKFGGELVPYYRIESGGAGMDLAKAAYRVVSR